MKFSYYFNLKNKYVLQYILLKDRESSCYVYLNQNIRYCLDLNCFNSIKIKELRLSHRFLGHFCFSYYFFNIQIKQLEFNDSYFLNEDLSFKENALYPLILTQDTFVDKFVVDDGNPYYEVIDDSLYFSFSYKGSKDYLLYLKQNYDSAIVLPEHAKYVGVNAFNLCKSKIISIDLNNALNFYDSSYQPDIVKEETYYNINANNSLDRGYKSSLKKVIGLKVESFSGFQNKFTETESMLFNAYLVMPKLDLKSVNKFYQLRLLHGFFLNEKLYSQDKAKEYLAFFKKNIYAFYNYVRDHNYSELLYLFEGHESLITKNRIKFIEKLSKKQSCEYLEKLILTNADLSLIKDLVEHASYFEYPSRALALACRYCSFDICKCLLDNGFKFNRLKDDSLDDRCTDERLLKRYNRIYKRIKDDNVHISDDLLTLVVDNLNSDDYLYFRGYYLDLLQKFNVDFDTQDTRVNSEETRVKILEYMLLNKYESVENLKIVLFFAALCDAKTIVDYLLSAGVSFDRNYGKKFLNHKSIKKKVFERGEGLFTLQDLYKKLNMSFNFIKIDDCSYIIAHHDLLKRILDNFKLNRAQVLIFLQRALLDEQIESIKLICDKYKDKLIQDVDNILKDDLKAELKSLLLELLKDASKGKKLSL